MNALADLVGVDPRLLAELIGDLTRAERTVALAESLTGGLASAVLTSVPGASAVVRGGVIVYATDLKHSLAGVDAALLAEVGAVHPDVARQLAVGVRARCAATYGIGLTGVAGPDPQDGQPVGTVHVCLAGAAGPPLVAELLESGSRAQIRAAAVRAAIRLLQVALARGPGRQRAREH